ncbi:MAG: hypothetical protein JO138_06115 [Acidobacteriaceae bacterium]|nr:hypothetical protein [Acidobacteriaceae bacterium]
MRDSLQGYLIGITSIYSIPIALRVRVCSKKRSGSPVGIRTCDPLVRELEDTAECRKRDPRLPPAGTVLERSYRGEMVRVTVLANGV